MPILEFNSVNPFTYPFGPMLGMNLYVLLIHIPIVFGFVAAAFYIIKYLRKFYGERQVPVEWKFFWWAMVWGTIHELIEVPILYQWVVGQILVVVFFAVQVISSIYLIYGSYLLAKKHTAK